MLASTDSEGRVVRRLWWAACNVVALAIIAIARALVPSPAGHGTHLQLGLPGCGFLEWTGLPCPACGLTTSFAHMARGSFASAFMSHPLGIPLFLLVLFAIPVSAWACLRAWPIVDTVSRFAAPRRVARWTLLFAIAGTAAWLFRIVIHLRVL